VSEIRIVRDYPYPVTRVWRALTDSALVPLWTATGAGGRPEGFAPVPGTRFRFVAKPKPGWNGIVNCEVVEAREPTLLRYTWTDDAGGDTTVVTYCLEPGGDGTRFTYEHTGFTGISGLFMSRMLGRIRRTMLTDGLPAVLADMDDDGRLRPGSALRARSLAGRRPGQHVGVALGGEAWRRASGSAFSSPAARLDRGWADVADVTGRAVRGAGGGVLAGSSAGPVVAPAPYIHVPVP
jgi:uncharacterized protein YndB with AHSA1/START domain